MRACMLAYSFYEEDSRIRRYAEALVKRGEQVDAISPVSYTHLDVYKRQVFKRHK